MINEAEASPAAGVGWNFQGRNALVTGGSRGIGRATVLALARAGANVVFSYASGAEQAEAVAAECRAFGASVAAVQADLRQKEAAAQLADGAREILGSVDLLVNNAGMLMDQVLYRMTDDQWHDVLSTHLHSLFYLTRSLVFDLVRAKGRVVNMASLAGLVGSEGQVNYATAKAGVIGFTKTMAKELGRFGVTVNAVAPGYIETDMLRAVRPRQLEKQLQSTALRRSGRAEEVADVILFLLSEASSYMTGQVLVIDGGLAG